MNNQNIELINSLITKTKLNLIHWEPLSSCPVGIKKEKGYNIDAANPYSVGANALSTLAIVNDASYFIHHKDGYIFLLAKNSFATIDNATISLVVQTEHSNFSLEYASSQDDNIEICSSLKRLYNIVDSYDYDIASFVNDFIKDK